MNRLPSLPILQKILLWGCLVVLLGVMVYTPLVVWLGVQLPNAAMFLKAWKELLLLMLIIVAVVEVTRMRLWQKLRKDWLLRAIAAYVALHLLLAILLYNGTFATISGLMIDLRYVAFFVVVYVLMQMQPAVRRQFVTAALFGSAIVVGFAVLQLFLPANILSYIGYSRNTIMPYLTVDQNPDYVRVNSTLRGPNPLGAFAIMVMGAVGAYLGRVRVSRRTLMWTTVLLMASIIALWISYSRSALGAAGVAAMVLVVLLFAGRVSRWWWALMGVVVICSAFGLVALRDHEIVSNVLFHENQNGGSLVSSNDEHLESLEYGITQALREPLGAGVGSTGSASLFTDTPMVVENQYLMIAHETGWLGTGLFVAIHYLVLQRLYKRRQDWLACGLFASGVGLAAIGLLLPVWADDTVSMVWWGMAAVAIGGSYAKRTSK